MCAGIALLAGHALAQTPGEPLDWLAGRPANHAGADGRAGKTVANFPIWKRITLGTQRGVNATRDALDAAKVHVGDSADEILGRPAFPFSKTRMELDLVVVTPADLGFAGSTPIADIYRRAEEFGLELCPAEAGPQLRLGYLNQPVGEFLHIAMLPVGTYHGAPVDLTVGNGGAGLVLLGGDGRSDLALHSSVKFVFVRPSRIALPNTPWQSEIP
jgi:hypothetical protein